MRIRTVKPELFLHDALFEAERASGLPLRLAFIGLWCASDREGRFQWEPRRLGASILPYDAIQFSDVMDALAAGGWVERYEVGGKPYGVVPSFTTHQIINNRETPSKIPPKFDACPTRAPRVPHASSDADIDAPSDAPLGEGKGREGKGREQNSRQARELLSLWNDSCQGSRMPQAQATPGNINRIAARLNDDELFAADFAGACAYVSSDPFYRGEGGSTFIASLDLLLKHGKAAELAEKGRAKSAPLRTKKDLLPEFIP